MKNITHEPIEKYLYDLLPQSEDLQGRIAPTAKKYLNCGHQSQHEFQHDHPF